MKNLKKILALVIVMSIITVMGLTAFTLSAAGSGVSITITSDPSAAVQSGSGPMNDYTYYKIFDASYESNTTTTPNGGVDASGTAQLGSGTATAVAYTATKAVKDALDVADGDNKYFVFTPIEKSKDGNGIVQEYAVSWNDDVQPTAENVQKAARFIKKQIVDANLTSGTKLPYNSAAKNWTKDNLEKGYYLIVGKTGINLIAATTDININEKNTYPDLDKSGTDNDGNSGTSLNVAIGQKIDYVVTVDVPATAIGHFKVTDTASKGLKLVGSVKAFIGEDDITSSVTITTATTPTGDNTTWWTAEFTVTEGNKGTYQGKKVQFKYQMEVTADALVDTEKKNTPHLEYGSGTTFIPVPPEVKYKTYFTGIEKVDLDDSGTKLDGVKFVLKQSSGSQMVEFPVTLSGSYYYPDPNGSAEVITGSGTKGTGVIIIRGLDDDKDYTLTETETLTGYNLLSDPLPLTLVLDSGTAYSTTTFEQIGNAKGSLLPSTGGIGTTIFYVVGAVLVIGTGVVLVTRRRMGNAD